MIKYKRKKHSCVNILMVKHRRKKHSCVNMKIILKKERSPTRFTILNIILDSIKFVIAH